MDLLSLNPLTLSSEIFITILDNDRKFQTNSFCSFSLELQFDLFTLEPQSNVILSPNVSVITISDDDEPTAGINDNI